MEVRVHGLGFDGPFSNPGFPSTCAVVLPLDAVIVKATVKLCVIPPPVPVTVTLTLPVVAVLLAAKVSVEFPLPGAAIETGFKVTVTPEGAPDADNETAALKPPTAALDIVVLPDVPWATDRLVGEALKTKSAA